MATNVVASIMATLGLDISDYQDKLEKARDLANKLPDMANRLFTPKDEALLRARIENLKRSADMYDQMASNYRNMSGQAAQSAQRDLAVTEGKLRDAEAQLAKVRQETVSTAAEKSKSATIKAIEREVKEAESQLRKAQTQAEKATKAYGSAQKNSALSSVRVVDAQAGVTKAQDKERHSQALAEATRAQIIAKQAAIQEATAQAHTIRGAARLNLLYKQLETLKTRLIVQENTVAERARITAKALQAQAEAQQNVAKAANEAMLASSGAQASNRSLRKANSRLATARMALETAQNADASKYITDEMKAETDGNKRVLAAVRAVETAKNNVAKAQDRVNNAVNREALLEQRVAKAAQQAEVARARAASLAAKADSILQNIKSSDFGLGKAAISAGALYGSLQAVQSLIESLVKPGFEYAQTMEQARIGIAATLRSMTKLDGDPINMNQALSAADSLIDRLSIVQAMTGTRMADVLRTYQGLLGPGLGAGMDTKQLIEYTQTGINAARAMQLPANQFIQELRDLVQGGISATSSTIASALGLSDADIKAAKESAEGLFVFLMNKMQGYNEMAGKTLDTIPGKLSLLESAVERASSKLTEAFTPEIKSLLDLVTSMFATLDRETGTFTINPEILSFIDRLHMKYMEILDLFGDFDVDGKFYPSEETLAKLEALKKFGSEMEDAFFGALDWLIKMEPVLEAIAEAVATVIEDAIDILGYLGDILLLLKDHADAVETILELLLKIVIIPGMILSGIGLVIRAFAAMLSPIAKGIKLLWKMKNAVKAIGVAAAIARLGMVGMAAAAGVAVGAVGAAGGKAIAEGTGWEGFKDNLSQIASSVGASISNAIDSVTGGSDSNDDDDETGFLDKMSQRQKELQAAWEQRMANWGLGIGKGDSDLASRLKADPKKDDKATAKANKERLRELQRRLKEAIEAEKNALEDIKQLIQQQLKKLDVVWKQGLMSAEEYYTTKAELEKKQAQAEYDSLARELELIRQTEFAQESVKNREILKVQREMMKAASKLGEAVDSFDEVNRFARETAIIQRNAQGVVNAQTAQRGAQAAGTSSTLPDDISGIPHSVVAYKMLTQQGFSDAIAKGIIASLMGESGRELRTTEIGDYGTSFGVGQWHNERWDDLANFANANHSDINDIRTQIAFLIHEITQGTQTGAFQQMLDYMKEYGETAENAARAWTIFLERPANKYVRGEERTANLSYVNADLESASQMLTSAAVAQMDAAEATGAAAQGAYKLYTRSTELEGEGKTWVRQTDSVDMENLTSRAKFMWNNMAAWFYEHYGKPLVATSGYRGNGEHFGDAIDYRGYIDLGDINSFDLFTDRDVWDAFTDYIQNFLHGGNADEYRDTTYGGWHGHADASGRNWTNAANGWGPAEYGGVDPNMLANSIKTAYSTALTESGAEAKEAIQKQYEDLLEQIIAAFDLVGEGAEARLLLEQRKFDELKNKYSSAYASFSKMREKDPSIDPDGTMDKIWQQAGTALDWQHNQKIFDIKLKDIESKQELKLKELSLTAERLAGNVGVFAQSADKALSAADINILDATSEVNRYGQHFFGASSEVRKSLDRFSQMGTEAEQKGILESWWQVQENIKKAMQGYSEAVQKIRDASSSFYDFRDQKLANNYMITDLQREEYEKNLKHGRAEAALRIDTAELGVWRRLIASINAEIADLTEKCEALNKQNELTEEDKEKLNFFTARIEGLRKQIQDINGEKILPLERSIELNKQLAHVPTLLEEVQHTASQAIENGLVTFLTDGINNAESLGDALRELAVGVLKELQAYFAKNLVRSMMTGINSLLGIKSPEQQQEQLLAENGAQIDANTQALQANTQALTAQQPAAAGQAVSMGKPVESPFQIKTGSWNPQANPYSFNPANYQLSLSNTNKAPAILPQQPYTFSAENYDLLSGFSGRLQSAGQQLEQALYKVGQAGTQAGSSLTQVDQASDQIVPTLQGIQQEIPTTMQSTIEQPFTTLASQLQSALTTLTTAIEQAATQISTAVSTIPTLGAGGAGGHATGGFISGPGTSTSDSIPARLSNGEFVMRAKAVRQYGRNMMERINNGTWGNISYRLPGFADGGYIGTMGAENTARGMSQFAGQIGTNVSTTNKMNIALVRDENEAIGHFMRSGPGQRIMMDFARKNAAVVSRFSGK